MRNNMMKQAGKEVKMSIGKMSVLVIIAVFLMSSVAIYGGEIKKATTGPGTAMTSIKVLVPSTGTVWTKGSTKKIEWNPRKTEGPWSIVLYKGNQKVGVIVANCNPPKIGNLLKYSWKVGETTNGMVPDGKNYKVRVKKLGASIKAKSGFFEIRKPTFKPGPNFGENAIKITRPNINSFWMRGTTHAIKWESVLNPPFKIELMNHSGKKVKAQIGTVLIYRSDKKYSYNWAIPSGQNPGKHRIRISAFNGSFKKLSKKFMIQFTHQTSKHTLNAQIGNKARIKNQDYDTNDYVATMTPDQVGMGNVSGQARVGYYNQYNEGQSGKWYYTGMIFRSKLYFDFSNYPGKNKTLVKATLTLKKKNTKKNVASVLHAAKDLYLLTAPWPPNSLDVPADLLFPIGTMGGTWTFDLSTNVIKWLQHPGTNHGLMLVGVNETLSHNNEHVVSWYTAELELEYISN